MKNISNKNINLTNCTLFDQKQTDKFMSFSHFNRNTGIIVQTSNFLLALKVSHESDNYFFLSQHMGLALRLMIYHPI